MIEYILNGESVKVSSKDEKQFKIDNPDAERIGYIPQTQLNIDQESEDQENIVQENVDQENTDQENTNQYIRNQLDTSEIFIN